MKSVIKYLSLSLLLFCACSQEEDCLCPGGEKTSTVNVPFSITLSTQSVSPKTKALDDPVSGTTDANTIKVYIFEDVNGRTELGHPEYFLYKGEGTITSEIKPSNGNYIATGNFTATEGSSYRVIAFAYNSRYSLQEPLFTASEKYSEAKVKLSNLTTPELFAGELLIKGGDSYIISNVTGETMLTGDLYRAVAHVTIKITDIPNDKNVESLTFITEKMATSGAIYNQASQRGYPIWFPDESDIAPTNNISVAKVDRAAFTTEADGTVTALLEAYFLPLTDKNRSLFFVDVKTSDAATPFRLAVKAADTGWIPAIWTGLFDKLITSNRFSLNPNHKYTIYGSYDKLAAGNLLIETGPITDSIIWGELN